MKNSLKLLATSLILILFVVSSCKKEKIEGCTNPLATNYDSDAEDDDGSCILEVLGCMDALAMNYYALANTDDGSCIFAYDIALGSWDINTICDSLTIGIPFIFEETISITEMFPDQIEISGEGNNVVSMDIMENEVSADIAIDGTVTIQDGQQISFDTSEFDPSGTFGEIDVTITGSGTIYTDSNGDLTLTMTFDIFGTPQASDCQIEFTR